MKQQWIEISVLVSQAIADSVSNRLIECGSQGTIFEDHPHDPDTCLVKAYYPQSLDQAAIVEQLRGYLNELQQLGFQIGPGDIRVASIQHSDWENNWKQFFKPLKVGKHLVIKPSWEPYAKQPAEIVVEINPGMAFGTGLHASTRQALAMLEQYMHKGDQVLDVGVGSGILSIAAVLLGAAYVLGVDVDAEAVAIAHENARLNFLTSPDRKPLHNRIELQVGSIDTSPIERKEEEGSELLHYIRSFGLLIHNQLVEDGWVTYVL